MKEKVFKAMPGGIFLMVNIALYIAGILALIQGARADDGTLALIGVVIFFVASTMSAGFFTVEPNGCKVLLLFGKYIGSVKESGFYWTNPFQTKRNLSLRVRTLNSEKLKVNDLSGNPIEIAIIVVWRVVDSYASSFEVNDYENYVLLQSETALRHSASSYPYDDEDHVMSLRQNADEVSEHIRLELEKKLSVAGVDVVETRIAHLAYSPEIAGAMLRRQQATAVIAARQRIVDGAVGMVEMALERMDKEKLIELDDERKAAMVSNLMVVLCSEHSVQPVVNAGSLYT